jgi:hypothetical protein
LPAPGMTLASAERPILPVFLPPSAPSDATPRAILSWGSALLHGISRRLRHRSLDRRHLSWGSLPLQRASRRASTSVRLPGRPTGFAGVSARGSHPADYGVAHRFSQPLSDFFLSPTSRHFQAGGVHGVCPSGVCSFHEAPTTHRRRRALLTLLPRAAHPRS